MNTYESPAYQVEAALAPQIETYTNELMHASSRLLHGANHDPILLAAAEVVESLATEDAIHAGMSAVAQKVDSQAKFYANYYDGTGRGIRETHRYPDHLNRLTALAGDRVASEANLQAEEHIERFIRAQQPGQIVEHTTHGRTETVREPIIQDGESMAYQITPLGVNPFGDKLIALTSRPVRVEGGHLADMQYQSQDPSDYSADQIATARGCIKLAWQDMGAGDSYRIYQKGHEDLTPSEVIRVMHWSEQRLAQTTQENTTPRWWENAAVAIVPKGTTDITHAIPGI